MKTELFIVEPGVYKATDPREVQATVDGLREVGLYHLPYETVTVRLPADELVIARDQGRIVSTGAAVVDITVSERAGDAPTMIAYNPLSGVTFNLSGRWHLSVADSVNESTGWWWRPKDTQEPEALRRNIVDFIITLLATRNAVKTTKVSKLATLGIGTRKYKNRYSHVTTISLPRPETMEHDAEHPPPSGATKAPHLRRGHVRHQHYGPQNAYIKRVWIAPVFVNADPDFVSQREAYNMTKGHSHADV